MSNDYSVLFNRKGGGGGGGGGGGVQRLKTEDFDSGVQNGSISDPILLEGLSGAEKKMISFFTEFKYM